VIKDSSQTQSTSAFSLATFKDALNIYLKLNAKLVTLDIIFNLTASVNLKSTLMKNVVQAERETVLVLAAREVSI
jgi:hypothetical protein